MAEGMNRSVRAALGRMRSCLRRRENARRGLARAVTGFAPDVRVLDFDTGQVVTGDGGVTRAAPTVPGWALP